MQITMQDNQLFVTGSSRFSARQTFTCGQCFRWTEQPDGSYLGIVRGIPARVSNQDGALVLSSDEQQFSQLWRDYFDCDTDYAAICDSFAVDAFTAAAADFGRGIRILRQEPWEALCTFILSQCNNIPRITGIVDRLCTLLGEPISFEQQTLHAFPSPKQLASCTPEDLASLRAGYRTPYLIAAAQAVCSGAVDFSALSRMDTDAARREIMQLRGVGRKVADCFLLFGLHKLDAFPVDTWMKKAAAYYSGDMKQFINSPYAGVYQQYFFFYTREHYQ